MIADAFQAQVDRNDWPAQGVMPPPLAVAKMPSKFGGDANQHAKQIGGRRQTKRQRNNSRQGRKLSQVRKVGGKASH